MTDANQTLSTVITRVEALEAGAFQPSEAAPVDVDGSQGDGTALTNLIAALETLGLITDSTEA